MMRMSAMMRGDAGGGGFGGFGGMGGFGGAGAGAGAGGFPAPGMPSYAQGQTQNQNPTTPSPGSPRAAGTGTGFNPSMYPPFPPATSPPPASGSGTGTGDTAAPAPGSPPNANAAANPFAALSSLFGSMPPPAQGGGASPFGMVDPALVQSLLGGLGGTATGTASTPLPPFAAPAPADTRPPEERFQVQLQQLQDMGFTNAAQNVRALLATAGNVHAAIEYILGGGGL